MIALKDIFWSAGFLEGEGCFQESRTTPTITVAQVEEHPLLRLQELFGGKVRHYSRRNPSGYITNYYRWQINGSPAAGLMMTLYPILSPKRQTRIERVIRAWKRASGIRKNIINGRFLPKEVCNA
jgi:hypothetical protein